MSSSTQELLTPSFKNILFATDFSSCSQAAIPHLRAIAERFGSTIHVVHVLYPEPTMLEVPLDIVPEMETELDVAQSTMRALLASKPFGEVACTTAVKRGPLWEVLAEFIEEKSIDLIVLGTHGRRGLKKLVLGSAAEHVFRHARCPVLTVGPQTVARGTEQHRIATILFATDFSDGSVHALPYAVSLARANSSRLILVHAVPAAMEIASGGFDVRPDIVGVPAEVIAEALESARQQAAELVSKEKLQEMNPEVIVECGLSAETILSVAKSKQADLIVMGAHRAPGRSIASHLPWATASTVVCEAHCPVLTVRS